MYEPKFVFMVFLMASMSFIGMSLYATFAQYDLTIYGSIIWGLMSCLLTMSLLFFFMNGIKFLFLIYSGIGVIITLIFVAVDT
jgi:FtsH-binding integral membrane protein